MRLDLYGLNRRRMHHDYRPARRDSNRLSGYDYSRTGAYFVTICTRGRARLFGNVSRGTMRRNEVGEMVWTVWTAMPHRYPGVELDACVLMPDHLHGIVVLYQCNGDWADARDREVGAGPRAGPDNVTDTAGARGIPVTGNHGGLPLRSPRLSLSDVVHRFKSLTTRHYADRVLYAGWDPFARRLWQRNYYDHVIRNEASLELIRRYIADNPARWTRRHG